MCKLDGRCRALAGLCQASDQAACRKLRPGKRPRLVRWPIGAAGRLIKTCAYYTNRDCGAPSNANYTDAAPLLRGLCCDPETLPALRWMRVRWRLWYLWKLPKRFRVRDKIERRCELLKASHCRLTRACPDSGLCSLYTEGKKAICIAATVADCQASSVCRAHQMCDVRGGRCVERAKTAVPPMTE